MSYIIARGKVFNIFCKLKIYIENDDIKIEVLSDDFEGKEKILIDKLIKDGENAPSITGNYKPPKNSLRFVINALKHGFFSDENYKIDVEGELEKIPYKKGVIY